MRRLLDEAMQAGAVGMSSGLIYVPDMSEGASRSR